MIVGGGVMGLWAAVKAEYLGLSTLLIDAGRLGGGASGGLLGSLMPHIPDRWSDKKQFQFDALVSLEDEIERLEGETGLSAGYHRCGRLIPLPKPHLRDIANRHARDADEHWCVPGRDFSWNVIDTPPDKAWLSADFTDAGLVHETLSGRISPRLLITVLVQRLKHSKYVQVIENVPVQEIDPKACRLRFADGASMAFGHCIVAAGHHAFGLLEPVDDVQSLGRPVKGQAALLKVDVDPLQPVVFLNGLYVVPHGDDLVAIGSTSEDEFSDADSTDEKLDDVLVRARALVPALRNAEVVERWAGLRPKAIGRDPMIGPHPQYPALVALAGGFKVSFGLAHRLADGALAAVTGDKMKLPPSFLFAEHINIARA